MNPQSHGRELHYFKMLLQEEQKAAIRRLADQRMGLYAIVSATQLSVEQVRLIVGERSNG
jgi:hypothetical protein